MKWVDCEYPDYKEQVPNYKEHVRSLQTKLKSGAENLIKPRYTFVAALLFLSLLQFGAMTTKAISVSFAAYLLMILPLGTRHLERIIFIVFVVASVSWLDLIPAGITDAIYSMACTRFR